MELLPEVVAVLERLQTAGIELGLLTASDEDFVPATIRVGDRSVRTRVRLKGDALDHLFGDKWSLRVHVRKSDQIFGMRRFSLQAPEVRQNHGEPIFLAHLRRHGIVTPRYFFVEVSINGKDCTVRPSIGRRGISPGRLH